MAIYHEDIVTVELSSGSIHRSFLNHSIGSGDTEANRFGVRVMRNGENVDLTGVSCFGYFRNAEGTNIALTSDGTVSGNVAYVTLPQACYNVEGQFTLAIKLIGGGVTGTMRIVDGVVDNTNTGSAVAPTGDVPTYTEILAVYDQMLEAVEDYDETVAQQNAEISNIKSAVSALNQGIDYITESTRNLANLINAKVGVSWNGDENSARAIVEIPVTPNTEYTISFSRNPFDAISWFEMENRTDPSTIVGYTITTSPTTKTTKSNTNFIILQFNKANIRFSDVESSQIQLEKGTVATPYIPALTAFGVDALLQTVDVLEQEETGQNLFDVNKYTPNKEYDGTGALIDSNVVGISGFIPVIPGKAVNMTIEKTSVPNYRIYYMVEFNSAKEFLRRVNVSTLSQYTPTEDAIYFIAEIVPSIIYKVKLEYESITTWTQAVDAVDLADFGLMASVNMFGSIAGIGDSYTAGMSANSGGSSSDMREQSYIATMGKRAGVDWGNYGVSGATAETYISNANGLPKVLAADPYDLYIINLGQNDINVGNTEGTIADIHDDWTRNPNTYCGNMGRIIARIKDHAPNAKIILVKSWLNTKKYGTDISYQSLDDSIQAIADYYYIPCISPFDDKFFNSAYYIPFRVQGHPTTMGYSMMGLAMERLFSKCVLNNPNYFMYSTVG